MKGNTMAEIRCVGPLAQTWRLGTAPLCKHRIERRARKVCSCGRKEAASAQAEARVS
jgi:hypothetical protein